MMIRKTWKNYFLLATIAILLLLIFCRQVLLVFAHSDGIVNNSIGDYIASLIGAMAGTFLAMFSAAYIDDCKDEKRANDEKNMNKKLLKYDINTMIRITQQNSAASYITEYINDKNNCIDVEMFINKIKKLYNLKNRRCNYLLSMEKRAEIIASAEDDFLNVKEKDILLDFFAGFNIPSKQIELNGKISHLTLNAISECISDYSSLKLFIEQVEKLKEYFKESNDKLDIISFSMATDAYFECFYTDFLQFCYDQQLVNDDEFQAMKLNITLDNWLTEADMVEKLFAKDRENLSNQIEQSCKDKMLKLDDFYNKFIENRNNQFDERFASCETDLFNHIILDSKTNLAIAKLKNIAPACSFVSPVDEITKKKKLDNLWVTLKLSPNVYYHNSDYLGECKNLINWLDFKFFYDKIKLQEWIKFKTNYFKLKYVDIPAFIQVLEAENWLQETPEDIREIIDKLESN